MAAEPTATPPVLGVSRAAVVGASLSLALWAVVGIAGPSAAVPGLGRAAGWPLPVDLGLAPSSALVTGLLAGSVVAGALALACALVALSWGWTARALVPVACAGALLTLLLPPVGSADHLSYAAYGRITALGGDAYTQAPDDFAGGTDPVVSAVRDPWRWTTSVYGPVATLLQGLVSLAGGDSVRATVWGGQLLLLVVWAVAAVLAHRVLTGPARARALVLWTANPLLLTIGLGGAHADVLAGSAAFAVLLLAWRHPWWAGVALGLAVGVKLPYGAAGAGLLVAWWLTRRDPGSAGWAGRSPSWLLRGIAGALVVLVPAHVWAGAGAYVQTERASRYVTLASLWRPLVEDGFDREALLPGMLVLMGLVVAVWWSHLVPGPGAHPVPAPGPAPAPDVAVYRFRARAAGVTAVLALGYLLAAPYVLPWYDVLLWAPLVLAVPVPALQAVLVARLGLLGLAYVPGLVEGMSPSVKALTLGFRKEVGPPVAWAALAVVVVLGVVRRRGPSPTGGARGAARPPAGPPV